MHDLVREAVDDMDAALELRKSKKDVVDIVDAVSELEIEEVMKLGMNFKKFPLGCDLTEILIGTCASDLMKQDLIGNCILTNMIGASIHVCAYAFADIAEAHGMRGIDVIKEVREVTDVPLDIDHFGMYGPMRFPRQITGCPGQCYLQGPPFVECPRGRIHLRLFDKEKEALDEKEEWAKYAASLCINLIGEQGGEGHAASIGEMEDVASLARKYGKGLLAIMFVGDGYDDLIVGYEKALDMGADVFVLEAGPFNRSKDRLESFAKAVATARILVPGKVVATNGAYEDECRIGLRAGLNAIISGFPKNHHGYMCGYSPGTAKRGNFGVPRIIKIIQDEIKGNSTNVPAQRRELEAIARAIKVAGLHNLYPNKIGWSTVGDAHWVCVANAPVYERMEVTATASSMRKDLEGASVALLGGRFTSWAIAKELDGAVDEIIISDVDPWVEKVTVETLREGLKSDIVGANGNDQEASQRAANTIITSTFPDIAGMMAKKIPEAITLIPEIPGRAL